MMNFSGVSDESDWNGWDIPEDAPDPREIALNDCDQGCCPRTMNQTISITSKDSKFLCNLIDWLNKQSVAPDSTIIRLMETN